MKKMLCLSIVFTLLCNLFSSRALATENPSGRIFNLDMSSYDSVNKTGLVNTDDNTTAFEIVGTPIFNLFDTVNGTNYYMTFSHDGTNKNTRIKVTNSSFLNQNALTVELWARSTGLVTTNTTDCDRLFGLTNLGSSTPVYISYDVMEISGGLKIRPGLTSASSDTYTQYSGKFLSATSYNQQWAHYVFTRSWDSNTSTWTFQTYINGQPQTGGSGSFTGVFPDETGLFLDIGGVSSTSGYHGDISKFRVYNTVLSSDEILSNYNNELSSFMELSNAMNFVSTAPAAGTIDINSGEITVNFDNYINPSTLNGVTFTKADGSDIKGKAYVSMDNSASKTLKIKYGNLEKNTQYKLTITENLKSLNGISASSNEIIFTTNDGNILYENFNGEEYVVGETAPLDKGINYTSSGVSNSSSDIAVCETGNGDKYLSLKSTTVNTSSSKASVNFSTPITDGVLFAEIAVRPASLDASRGVGNAPREVCRVYLNSSLTTVSLGYMHGGTTGGIHSDGINEVSSSYTTNVASADENGFYHMKYVMQKDPSTGYYYFEGYNMNDPSMYYKRVVNASEPIDIRSLMLTHIYPETNEQSLYDRAEISEVKIYKINNPDILYSSIYNLELKTMDLVFTDDMDASTIIASNIIVTKEGSSESLVCTPSYNAQTRTMTLEFSEALEEGSNYSIAFTGVKSIDDISPIDTYEFVAKAIFYNLTKNETSSYIIEYTPAALLKPNAISNKSFRLYDCYSNYDIPIGDVYYYPRSNLVKLVVESNDLYNKGYILENTADLVDINNNIFDFSCVKYISEEYSVPYNAISVEQIDLFYNGNRVYKLYGHNNITVSAKFVNTSDYNYENLEFNVYVNDDTTNSLYTGNVSIGKDSNIVVEFNISNYVFNLGDKLNVIFSQQ